MPRHRALLPYLLGLVLVGILAAAASADVIHLRTGGKVVGTIEEEGEGHIVVRVHGGRMRFLRSNVREIVRDAPVPQTEPPEATLPEGDGGDPIPTEILPAGQEAPEGTVLLWEALSAGWVSAAIRGKGLTRVSLAITPRTRHGLAVFVPAGTYFVAGEGNGKTPQDMLVVRSHVVRVGDEAETTILEAACARWERRAPGPTDVLQTAPRAPDPALSRLAGVLEAAEADTATSQAAVWIVTNDTDYDDLGRMGVRAVGSMYADRSIREREAATAMMLVEASGVALDGRKIGRDTRLVIWALPHATLGPWALRRARAQGLGATAEAVVVRLLQRHLRDESVEGRRLLEVCGATAAKLRATSALPELKQALADQTNPPTRRMLALAYAQLAAALDPPTEAVDQLLWLLTHPDLQDVALIAVEALEDEALSERVTSRADRTRVGHALMQLLATAKGSHAGRLKDALEIWLDALDTRALVEASRRTEPELKKTAVHLLLLRAGPEALDAVLAQVEAMPELIGILAKRRDARPHLLPLTRSTHVTVRRSVAEALGALPPADPIERALSALLRDDDAQVRAKAVRSLGHGDYRRAAVAVRARLLADADLRVRQCAAQALMNLLQSDAVPALRAARERARSEEERSDLDAKIRLASALVRPGGR